MDILVFKDNKIKKVIRNVEVIKFNPQGLLIIHSYYDDIHKHKPIIQYQETVFVPNDFDEFEVRES